MSRKGRLTRQAAGLGFKDLQPILDGDARGFHSVFRIERVQKRPDLVDRLVFESFFKLSDSVPGETEESPLTETPLILSSFTS